MLRRGKYCVTCFNRFPVSAIGFPGGDVVQLLYDYHRMTRMALLKKGLKTGFLSTNQSKTRFFQSLFGERDEADIYQWGLAGC
jgi:hypothetical protein